MSKLPGLSILVIGLSICSGTVAAATQRTLDEALQSAIDEVCPTGGTVPLGLGSNLNQYCEDRKLFSVGIPVDPAGVSGSSTSHQNRQSIPDNRAAKEAMLERGRWNLFVTARIEQIDKALTQFEPAFKSDVSGISAGIDYRLTPKFNFGLALTQKKQEGDFNQNGGEFDVVDIDFLIFSIYQYSDSGFIETALSLTQRDIETTRRFRFEDATANNSLLDTDTLVSSDNESSSIFLSIRGGNERRLQNGITLGISSGLQFEQLKFDGFSESGDTALALTYRSRDEEKLTGEVSVLGSMVGNMSWGVIVPQLALTYQIEFLDDQQDIRAVFSEDERDQPTVIAYSNDPPDRSYFRLNIGASVNLQNGVAAFFDYSEQMEYDDLDQSAISIGVRKEL